MEMRRRVCLEHCNSEAAENSKTPEGREAGCRGANEGEWKETSQNFGHVA